MQKIPRQEQTAEFKEQAVMRMKDGKSVSAGAKEIGLGAGVRGARSVMPPSSRTSSKEEATCSLTPVTGAAPIRFSAAAPAGRAQRSTVDVLSRAQSFERAKPSGAHGRLHNFDIRHADGTTAADRFSGRTHHALFEQFFLRVPLPPRPGGRRRPPKRPYLMQVAA